MICPSVMIICSDCWIFCLFICTLLSLFHSPRYDSRRCSLLMRVLSHSDTHHRNRYMAWCGSHEILIQLSFNVLFLTNFCQLPLRSLAQSMFRKLKSLSTRWPSLWKFKQNNHSFNKKTTWLSSQFSAFAQTLCCLAY